ncbi:hypothetical protein SSPO_071020 [Streptomyces antimycoticus]|uniref:Uncharacterized protein n=1 Tax=Streptomyces antimycoticus TaxID=68175 RepID=A0A4D4JZA0_9ACTN|nr:hypothetical protein SSPO_071020 [Streptomyces antimycoticus]GDY42151.1 hypothetical protein SANT12839_030330 [Streptomyces antimycoticus]
MVFVAENGKFSEDAISFQCSAPVTDRRVKYIAKRAAKNISSELSQMMVPTLVRFGRLTDGCACPVSTAVAVATTDIMSVAYPALTPGVPFGVSRTVARASTLLVGVVRDSPSKEGEIRTPPPPDGCTGVASATGARQITYFARRS